MCGRRSVTFDPFMYLSVPLPEDAVEEEQRQEDDFEGGGLGGAGGRRRGRPEPPGGVSLASCIERFCEEETLEGGESRRRRYIRGGGGGLVLKLVRFGMAGVFPTDCPLRGYQMGVPNRRWSVFFFVLVGIVH